MLLSLDIDLFTNLPNIPTYPSACTLFRIWRSNRDSNQVLYSWASQYDTPVKLHAPSFFHVVLSIILVVIIALRPPIQKSTI